MVDEVEEQVRGIKRATYPTLPDCEEDMSGKIEWKCAGKVLSGVTLFALFIAFIATGGFVGNFVLSLVAFFSVGFSALGWCLYGLCASANRARKT